MILSKDYSSDSYDENPIKTLGTLHQLPLYKGFRINSKAFVNVNSLELDDTPFSFGVFKTEAIYKYVNPELYTRFFETNNFAKHRRIFKLQLELEN